MTRFCTIAMDSKLVEMKFLVTGSAGLVGRQVTKDLARTENQVYSCYHKAKPQFGIPTQLDLENSEDLREVIQKVKPQYIIHLGALTDLDLCEIEQDHAMQINAKATEVLSKEAAKIGSFFLYVSTDYVFDGKTGMKKETDTPDPVNFYGKSKLYGEQAVMDMASSWCIARTSTPFGLHPTKRSFPYFVAQNLGAKKEIIAVTDQHTSPTYVPNLSRMLIELVVKQIVGVIHVVGTTRISRYELAKLVADKLGFDKELIKPSTIKEMNWKARRPADSSLDVTKAYSILKEKPLGIDESLDLFIKGLKGVNHDMEVAR